jgi:hypothetical protein
MHNGVDVASPRLINACKDHGSGRLLGVSGHDGNLARRGRVPHRHARGSCGRQARLQGGAESRAGQHESAADDEDGFPIPTITLKSLS